MIFQPDVAIETSTEVDYDPSWVTQPEVEIVTGTEINYTLPVSSGGQPQITIRSESVLAYTPPLIYSDIEGHTNFRVTTSATFDVEIEPTPVPVTIDMKNVRRVSITMPRPEEYDRFGRPVR